MDALSYTRDKEEKSFLTIAARRDSLELLDDLGSCVVELLKNRQLAFPHIDKSYVLCKNCLRACTTRSRMLKIKSRTSFRVIAVLEIVSYNLRNGNKITVRDLYYLLKHLFTTISECHATVFFVSRLLGVSRSCLCLLSSSKGMCAGFFDVYIGGNWSQFNTSFTIPSTAAEGTLQVRPSFGKRKPNFIVVVEKEAVFQQIYESRIYEKLNFILITGKGVPDLATRAFLKALYQSFRIRIFGCCDFNPYGLKLMLNYVWGGQYAPEAYHYAVPLTVIGLSFRDISSFSFKKSCWQQLSQADISEIKRLMKLLQSQGSDNCIFRNACYELESMLATGVKLELESLNQQTRETNCRWFQDKSTVERNAKCISPSHQGSFLSQHWLPKALDLSTTQLSFAL